jgi:hypothetical protein
MSKSFLLGPEAPGWNRKTMKQIRFDVEAGKTYYVEWYLCPNSEGGCEGVRLAGNGVRLVDATTGAQGLSATEPATDKDLEER